MENAFNEGGVMVTRNGLSVAGQMFAFRDMRAVEVVTVHRNKPVPVGISLIGAVAAIAGGFYGFSAVLVAGVMLIVVGYLTWISQDVTHRLIVDTPDGKREALSSVDLAFVERVAGVVRHALDAAKAGSPAG